MPERQSDLRFKSTRDDGNGSVYNWNSETCANNHLLLVPVSHHHYYSNICTYLLVRCHSCCQTNSVKILKEYTHLKTQHLKFVATNQVDRLYNYHRLLSFVSTDHSVGQGVAGVDGQTRSVLCPRTATVCHHTIRQPTARRFTAADCDRRSLSRTDCCV